MFGYNLQKSVLLKKDGQRGFSKRNLNTKAIFRRAHHFLQRVELESGFIFEDSLDTYSVFCLKNLCRIPNFSCER